MDTSFLGPAFSLDDFITRQKTRRDLLATQLRSRLPSGSITLEIGSGHGHFLTAYATAHPESCVGIDICRSRVLRSGRKQERAALGNLLFFRCDADDFLSCLPEEITIGRVFILFPDPWSKRRHHKNRLISENFLTNLAATTALAGELYFRTDHLPYFEAAAEVIAAHTDWKIQKTIWPFESPTVFQDRAENYWSLAAHRITGVGEETIRIDPSRSSEITGSLPPEPAVSS